MNAIQTSEQLTTKKCTPCEGGIPAYSADEARKQVEKLPGWKSSTLGMTELDALPANARSYVDFLSEKIGVEIGLISTGPERSQTIVVQDSTVGGWLRQ